MPLLKGIFSIVKHVCCATIVQIGSLMFKSKIKFKQSHVLYINCL